MYRINAGGPTLSDPGGDWVGVGQASPTCCSGNVTLTNATNAADVTTTDSWDMSQITTGAPVELWGSLARTNTTVGNQMNWAFNVPNGAYEVRLYFGEHTSTTINDIGGRVYDVALEGNTVLDDFDKLAETSGVKGVALERIFPAVDVTDGVLNLDITSVVSVATIRGIEILAAGNPNQAPSITATPEEISVTAGQSEVVDLTTSDPDGDPLTTQITSGPGFAGLVNGDLVLSPQAGDVAGSPYTVTVETSDGDLTASVDVTVTVLPATPVEGGVFGDFDGDGTTDFAVWRSSTGRWFIEGVAGSTAWGKSGDVPVVGDFTGDGTTDVAVWRPASGRWYVNGIAGSTQWGLAGDVPVPGDYDGDGTTDFAVYRPSTGRWYVEGIAGSTQWGKDGDVVAPGDYDGDGTTDFAVWRPTNGRWYVEGIAGSTQWGLAGDVAVPGDYDGDGTTDFAVWRPSTGRWFVEGIAGSTQWGKDGDVVAPGDYDGDGTTDFAVWRPTNGRWYVEGIAGNTPWGVGNKDTPVTAPIHVLPGLLGA